MFILEEYVQTRTGIHRGHSILAGIRGIKPGDQGYPLGKAEPDAGVASGSFSSIFDAGGMALSKELAMDGEEPSVPELPGGP
jgi:hypothetical protein